MTDNVSFIGRGLEKFPATIALLDSRGDIVYTNRSRRAFADANDYASDPDSTSVNYLVVCNVVRGTDEIAGVVADGIRAILRDDRDLFTTEYPCHPPAVYRWFVLRVVPIDTPGHGSFTLVSYFDVTDRQLAELQVNEKNEHLTTLVSMLASELKAQLASATTSAERLTAADGDAAVTLPKNLSRTDSLVEWDVTVAGQPSTPDLGAVEPRPHVAQVRALAPPDGTDGASLQVVDDGSFSADTHLFDLFLVAVPTDCYRRNISSGSSPSVIVGTTADDFYVDDDGPRPSPEELAAVTADSNQLLGVDYDAIHLSTARQIADLHGWQFDVGGSELSGACSEVRGVGWN